MDAEEASHLMNNLDFVAAVEDLQGAAKYLKEEKRVTKVGVIGKHHVRFEGKWLTKIHSITHIIEINIH